jgi:hypothetical protein
VNFPKLFSENLFLDKIPKGRAKQRLSANSLYREVKLKSSLKIELNST